MTRWRQHLQDEDGLALITALLAVVILSGLVVVFLGRAITETRASAFSQSFETAVHAAEASSDFVIRELNRDDDYVTVNAAGVTVTEPDGVDERTWTLDRLGEMRGSDTWVETADGEAFAIRPVDDEGKPVNVIYAAGAIPSFDAERASIRVLKLQVAQDDFTPNYALLSDTNVTMKGSAMFAVAGCDYANPDPEVCIADVHTNQTFDAGSGPKVHGTVTSAGGSCTSGAPAIECLGSDEGVATQPIPAFSARDFYRPNTELNQDPGGQDMGWFDLCPDKTVKAGSGGGPCTGEQIWPSATETGTRFRGWRHQTTGSWSGWVGNPVGAGAFYVYRSDVRVNGSAGDDQRSVSVIVETDPTQPLTTGSLQVGGYPRIQSAFDDVLMITDRDFAMAGGESGPPACDTRTKTQFSGFIGVGEQATMSGAAMLSGAMIIQDKSDDHKLVERHNDEFAGEMCLDFDPDMVIDLTGYWVITYWNEL